MSINYDEYIQSAEWQQRSDEAKQSAGNRCRVCNRHASDVVLYAYHRTYERLGHEDPDDITVLCCECYELYYMHHKVPPPSQPYSSFTHTKLSFPFEYKLHTVLPIQLNTTSLYQPTTQGQLVDIMRWYFSRFSFSGVMVFITFVSLGILCTSVIVMDLIHIDSVVKIPTPTTLPPTKILASTTSTHPSIATPSTSPDSGQSIVKQTALVCGNPCRCSPLVRTIIRGTQVAIWETTSCGNDTWYRIGEAEWLGPGIVDPCF